MAENMNMREIKLATFLNFIREQIEDEDYTPVMGIGKSGIGKTEGVAELCKEMGIGFCELRLVTMTEVDLLGVPMVGKTEGGESYTDWASNKLLPIESRDGERGILVLDEITSATSTIRAAAYQLLDSKRSLGNYKLPDHWLVVAIGNGIEDGGVYQGMEGAFINRCKAFRVVEDFETWKTWAIAHDANPSVIAFLQFKPDELHKFDPNADVEMFPSPRAWMSLSRMLNRRETKRGGVAIDKESAGLYACSAVGVKSGAQFEDFYGYNKNVASVDDILDGKISASECNFDTQAFYILEQQVVRKLGAIYKEHIDQDEGTMDKRAVEVTLNIQKFLMGIPRLDNTLLMLRDLTANVPEFLNSMLEPEVSNSPVGQQFYANIVQKNSTLFNGGRR